MRVFTSFFTSPPGSGLSAGNRIVPLARSYSASSFSCPDGVSTGIEGAMVLRSPERDQQPRSETVAWDVVADALFGGGRRGFDISTKLLKRGSLRGADACKVAINRFRLGRHDFFCVRIAAESQVIFSA